MKVTYSWLKEWVPCDLSVEELAEKLTMQGLSVEGIEYLGKGLEDIKVAQVVTKEQHPNADRLSLCRVTDGQQEYSIVCGAPNHKSGDKVALALPGTVLPAFEGKPLKKTKIRGVESFGMMCSERELGLSDDHEGIIILSPDAELGRPFVEEAGLDDYVIEFEITTNRGDCLSVVGIARELSALLRKPVQKPSWQVEQSEARESDASVEIFDEDLCPRYCARIIEGVRIGPSPAWMKRRLEACGIRSINNIVDISNYVLLEFGHPLHAFDLDTLEGRKIIVRRAKPGEKIITIDEKERVLHENNLVIADAQRPVALAGVMGGKDTEVSEQTVNLLIESAYFDPISIRKTSKEQVLSTEASYRFERGADWEGLVLACERCTRLIQEFAGGTVVGGLIDIQAKKSELIPKKKQVDLRIARANRVLDIHLSPGEAITILSSLGFDCKEKDSEALSVNVPCHRNDVSGEIDLIEELARVYGYNRIRSEIPKTRGRLHPTAWRDTYGERIRSKMVSMGYSESMTPSFISEHSFDRLRLTGGDDLRRAIQVINPLSSSETLLRTTLIPSVLEVLGRNARRLHPRAAIFEIARGFLPQLPDPLRCERPLLSGGAYGPREKGWLGDGEHFDFFDVKGVIEELLEFSGIEKYGFRPVDVPFLQPGRSAGVYLGDQQIGILGEVHPETAEAYALRNRVAIFEIALGILCGNAQTEAQPFSAPSPYPPVTQDLALVVDESIPVAEISAAIEKAAGKFLEDFYLFDVFTGGKVPQGKRNLNFRLIFRSPDKTLKEEEVTKMRERVMRTVEKQFGATLPAG